MQAKIYRMFPDADKAGMQDYDRNIFLQQPRSALNFRPAVFFVKKNSNDLPVPAELISAILISAENTLVNLDRSDRDFLHSMKMVLIMFYRYCRSNTGTVAYLMDLLEMEGQSTEDVLKGLGTLNSNIICLLKNQAVRKGHISGEDTLEDLIFFMLEEVLKMYLSELGRCCCAVFQDPRETFPSEKEMMDRFFAPLASQLKGLIAS